MSDTRIPAERAYDELKSGQAYVKPEPERSPLYYDLKAWIDQHLEAERAAIVKPFDAEQFAAGYQAGTALGDLINQGADEAAIADWTDKHLPTDTDAPIGLQIERHTHHTNGEPASDPWTTYAFGEAEIDIQDAGSVNLYLGQESIEIEDNAQLFDLIALLSHATVQAALDRDDDAKPDEGPWGPILDIICDPTNNGREMPIVRSLDAAHRDERLLNILETIAAMDEPAKSEAFGYAMGVFDGLAAKDAPAA